MPAGSRLQASGFSGSVLAVSATLALALSGCNCGNRVGATDPLTLPHQVGTFRVQVVSVTTPDDQPLLPGDGVTEATAWPFPFGKVKIHVKAQALDERGEPFTALNRAVAIRVTPGDIDPSTRTLDAKDGAVEGDIVATHVFGRVNVWVLDGPADEAYGDGGASVPATPASAPDVTYSNAAGASQALYFRRPSLADIQRQPLCDPSLSFQPPAPHVCNSTDPTPDGTCHQDCECTDLTHNANYHCYQHTCEGACDNRVSPLTGDFVDVEQEYTSADAGLIVTAITQDGFYVSDLSAQKYSDQNDPAYPAWQSLVGNFGHLFVYTYSAPNNLYVGDHLISLTGSVQEFSGDTQLDFPAWVKVDQLPTPEFIQRPVPLTLAMCGSDSNHSKSAQDLCGYYNGGVAAMTLESLESSPVVFDHAMPTNLFVNCDSNGNGTLPLFANSSANGWGCFPDDPNGAECACEIACITGRPQVDSTGATVDYSHFEDGSPIICSEDSTYTTFGQWELALADDLYPDGGVALPSLGTRISVNTRDALSGFNPHDLQKPEHQGVTFRIAGELIQVQASRPRWVVYARDPTDVCCHEAHLPDGGVNHCPAGVNNCELISGQ